MHKGTHRSREKFREEYQDDSRSHPFKNEHHAGRERNDADHRKSSARNSQWRFGNLFECLSDDENCSHGRVPFGDSFYCMLPLKDTSANLHDNRPCVWDAEKYHLEKEAVADENR